MRRYFAPTFSILKSSRSLRIFFVLFLAIVFVFSLRGLPGNPTTADMMASNVWRADGPLELSPERGRFALLYSLAEDGTPFFSLDTARLATPDLAVNPDGRFVSMFAPFLSFLLVPGYFIGKMLGASVLGATAMIALFALGNAALIALIAERLGARRGAAILGALAFLFGTPAFAYATTMYQHHVSVFLLLLSFLLLLRSSSFFAFSGVAFLFGFSVALDNPNAILFVPVLLFALVRAFPVSRSSEGLVSVRFRPALLFSIFFALVPLAFFFRYNASVNGGAFRLSGTLPGVPAISVEGRPLDRDPSQLAAKPGEERSEKTAVGFFETRSLLNGFFIHLASPDRGVIRYAPVILLGIFGWVILYRKNRRAIANVLTGTSLAALVLYSLWGDPWGGWAFGSRYLIPAYAMLGIGLGVALDSFRKSKLFLGVFVALLVLSVGVNTLGALTSNANPPQVQVLALEALSGREQKYTAARNWQYLHESGSKSFLYQAGARHLFSAEAYFSLVVFLILAGSAMFFVVFLRDESSESISKPRRL